MATELLLVVSGTREGLDKMFDNVVINSIQVTSSEELEDMLNTCVEKYRDYKKDDGESSVMHYIIPIMTLNPGKPFYVVDEEKNESPTISA